MGMITIPAMEVVLVILFMFVILPMHIRLPLNICEKEKTNLLCEVFNLGTGNGVTVLEAINAFEKVSGVKLNYTIGPRRPGDIIAIYANNDLAKKALGWEPKYRWMI